MEAYFVEMHSRISHTGDRRAGEPWMLRASGLPPWSFDMKGQSVDGLSKTEQDILAWIVARVAESCGVRPDDIEAERPLTDYVFDSIEVLEANVALTDWLGIEVPGVMLWAPPSMADAARQITELAAGG